MSAFRPFPPFLRDLLGNFASLRGLLPLVHCCAARFAADRVLLGLLSWPLQVRRKSVEGSVGPSLGKAFPFFAFFHGLKSNFPLKVRTFRSVEGSERAKSVRSPSKTL